MYIGRDDFEIETDMGERIQERSSQKALLEDWDLDLETRWHQSERGINEPRSRRCQSPGSNYRF